MLELAAWAEQFSEHPLARAVLAAAPEFSSPPPERFEAITGKGIAAEGIGRRVLVGSAALLEQYGIQAADSGVRLAAMAQAGLTRRHIFDLRLALTAQHHGVTQWATRNTRDFEGLGFQRLIDPLADD